MSNEFDSDQTLIDDEIEFGEPDGFMHFGFGDKDGWMSLCGFNFKPICLNPFADGEPDREFCKECVRIAITYEAMLRSESVV
jgi:hypothetical protein